MPIISGITIPAGLENNYSKALKMFAYSNLLSVGKNSRFFSRNRINALKDASYLSQIAQSWSYFTDNEKLAWIDAGNVCGMNGYNLFVQDQSYRIKNSLDGFATPSLFHQYLVGHINLSDNANSIVIKQSEVEDITFPLSFQLCRKSNLISSGNNSFAKLILRINRTYEDQEFTDEHTIDLPLVSDWQKQSLSVEEPLGIANSWELSFELNDVSGDLWFDNLWLIYNGVINNLDPNCEEVNLSWNQILIPDGAIIESVYPNE